MFALDFTVLESRFDSLAACCFGNKATRTVQPVADMTWLTSAFAERSRPLPAWLVLLGSCDLRFVAGEGLHFKWNALQGGIYW